MVLMKRLASLGPLWRQQLIKRAQLSTAGAVGSSTTGKDNFDWLCSNKVSALEGKMQLGICRERMGHLAESSILGRAGGSVVHVALASKEPDETPKEDFLPLTVDYRARAYGFGIIPDVVRRREKHGDDDQVLVARFIDRAIRPLFPSGYVNEVQLTVTPHAVDPHHDPTVLALNAASLALMNSKHPWNGPIGCVRVGMVNNQLTVNPSFEQMQDSPLDLLYAGTKDRTVMIEAGGKEIPESLMVEAMQMAHEATQQIVQAQLDFINGTHSQSSDQIVQREKVDYWKLSDAQKDKLCALFLEEAKQLYLNMKEGKDARGQQEGAFIHKVKVFLSSDPEWSDLPVIIQALACDYIVHKAFRDVLLDEEAVHVKRVDGRSCSQVRPIACQKEVLPSVHGSAYFSRGDTHVLCTTTLASPKFSREVIPLEGNGEIREDTFMLHYDFPPYCTGEVGNSTQVNRRMVGHGNLAEKALKYVMPPFDKFPYVVRVFAECVSSNGSSSMAATCGGALALLDAGVPIQNLVAGVSVGLITDESFGTQQESESSRHILLKDIIGSEDHNGDMDFKVAGTDRGITAIQLDVKLPGGVPLPILFDALKVAREGRLEILEFMKDSVRVNPNVSLRPHAPRAEQLMVDEGRHPHLIGPGGQTLALLEKAFDVEIDVDDDTSKVHIFGKNAVLVEEARQCVEDIAVTLKEGTIVTATVVSIKEFGIVVRVNRAGQGIIHVRNLTFDKELAKQPLDTIFHPGQCFKAKVIQVDNSTGEIRLARTPLLNSELEKDTLSDVTMEPHMMAATRLVLNEMPKFPVNPPKAFNREFFRHSIVSPADVARAMNPPAREAAAPQQPSSDSTESQHRRQSPNYNSDRRPRPPHNNGSSGGNNNNYERKSYDRPRRNNGNNSPNSGSGSYSRPPRSHDNNNNINNREAHRSSDQSSSSPSTSPHDTQRPDV